MHKKKILVVSQYFYPEQFRINDICRTWVKKGYEVTVLTGIPNYPQGDFYEGYGYQKNKREIYEGVTIKRIPIVPRKKNSIMMGLNYLSFVISGELWKILNRQNFDLVFIYEVSPMTQALPAVRIAKKLNIPCYIYVMDLWPENFEIITGITHPLVIEPLNKMVDYIYKNCTKIFTASRSFKKNIENRGIDSQKIYFWPQYAEEFYQISEVKSSVLINDKKVNITFAGNIGIAQGLDILPEVGKKIKEKQLNVRFNFVGDGRYKQDLIKEIERNELQEWFHFVEAVPATEIPEILASSDFSFVSLQKNDIFSMTIPAKLQSSMACGKPILLSASGEVAEIVKKANCGFVGEAGDSTALFNNLIKISHLSSQEITKLGINARKYFEEEYEKEKLLSIMDGHLM
ncbi:glycosyltransferase WbuB [Enterococcus villorum]|uniref:Glycosyltransferase WbuB n=2 Tax=Enterococcus villorum TaxID=112904 RepID=A0A1V8Y818_9ENTE|nr:glycosyltransferase family 4 protein [Enterococcus villorum]EOH86213.1 hypothetical protein UAO_02598 [Enterococcus villorum ATCC 700913]EOW78713.1 hypothetical protein I591_00256 [Enterococcus villorum ATCC 700913]OQO68715.1 glycosyltransferase WbuB [Enterococcus villorum]OQO73238.1 glycosyltransferase WbuB [Enterococcus villorum]GEL91580.1 glycosyltransferase WbuB [Enterococcus villorum]